MTQDTLAASIRRPESSGAPVFPVDNQRLDALTGIRFFAAFAVVCVHVGGTALRTVSGELSHLLSKGYTAVGMFYALSGFVLAYSYARRGAPWKRFMVARLARIYPVYLLALLLSLPVYLTHARADHEGTWKTLSTLGAVPTLMQSWFPSLALGWNTPAWSLSVEAFFYLAFPLLLPILIQMRPAQLRVILGVAFVVAALPSVLYVALQPEGYAALAGRSQLAWTSLESNSLLGVVNFNPLFRLAEFVAGVALGCLYLRAPGKRRLGDVITLFSVVALVIALRSSLPYPLLHNGLLLPLWCSLIYGLCRSHLVARALSLPVILLLGEASYGLYILQQPVSSYFKLLLLKTTGLHITGDYPTMGLFLAYVVLLIAVSVASHRWVELPARDWVLALSKKRVQKGVDGGKEPRAAVSVVAAG